MDVLKTLEVTALFIIFTNQCVTGNVARPLNDVVSYYEPIHFDSESILRNHHRAKRGADIKLSLRFKAFDKHFNLQLLRNHHVYTQDAVFESSTGPISYDTSRTYNGIDNDDVMGRVHGVVTSTGHFEGQLIYPNETYHIESSRRHFEKEQEFSSIIYRSSDVTFNVNDAMCKAEELHMKMMKKHQKTEKQNNKQNHSSEDWSDKYRSSGRHRRDINSNKTVCELYLKADHTFYNKFYQSHDAVIEQMTNHVEASNNIFRQIDFDGDNSPDDISFIIKRVTIYDDATAAGYKFPAEYSVEKLLDLHSQENYDDYCLAILFSYRDFNSGVLGLAWTAAANLAGGVCEKYRTYQGEAKSLNTALVTMLNYGQDVSSAVSHATFAHEVGHNFGSQHDPSSGSCAPGGSEGNFIMFPMATSGNLPNNKLFSTCSVGYMAPILKDKARDDTNGCFKAPTGAICGNNVVEDSEECDCGWEEQCTENCCNPQNGASSPTPCTRVNVSASSCSPSEGPCCSDSCILYTAGENQLCRSNTSCLSQAVCDGTSVICPASSPEPNGTQCAEGQVCYLGECSGSVCLAHSLEPCQCSPTEAGNWKDEKLCQVCCIYNGECKSTSSIPSIPATDALPGSSCNDYQGYCDVFQVCRQVDPTGPLATLKNLLLEGELLETLKTFLTKHWYIGIAAGVAFIVVMILVAKFCSKHHGPPPDARRNQVTPSPSRNDPRKTIDMHHLRHR